MNPLQMIYELYEFVKSHKEQIEQLREELAQHRAELDSLKTASSPVPRPPFFSGMMSGAKTFVEKMKGETSAILERNADDREAGNGETGKDEPARTTGERPTSGN